METLYKESPPGTHYKAVKAKYLKHVNFFLKGPKNAKKSSENQNFGGHLHTRSESENRHKCLHIYRNIHINNFIKIYWSVKKVTISEGVVFDPHTIFFKKKGCQKLFFYEKVTSIVNLLPFFFKRSTEMSNKFQNLTVKFH